MILDIYKNKRVLITGHTGFKGSWMTRWLLQLGADVYGYALEPHTQPSLYKQLNLKTEITSEIDDVRDFNSLKNFIKKVQPDIIFHLAAQSLVLESYVNPLYTIETNITGTANLLEAVRQLKFSTNIVVITSDKCYENKEWLQSYRENDPMGGYDPYSVSKGGAELIVSAWRRSFFNGNNYSNHGVKLASARAGNVIGGGDWADNRIVPDCIRSLRDRDDIYIRNPLATRPWQHVLEPIGAYLLLGEKLMNSSSEDFEKYCSGFNFGPQLSSNKTVEILVEEILKNWGEGSWIYKKSNAFHEAFLLNLSIDKAYHLLGWEPVWGFKKTVIKTVQWYKSTIENPDEISKITERQIDDYSKAFNRI